MKICFSLQDDPHGKEINTYEELMQLREGMAVRTTHMKERVFSCIYFDAFHRSVTPVGVTTTHAFLLAHQNRHTLLAAMPLHQPKDTPYQAYHEKRQYKSPWSLCDKLKVPVREKVLATACFRDIICVLFDERLVIARHVDGKWVLLENRELPNKENLVPSVAICLQCVAFVYRNPDEKCCYFYVLPLSELGGETLSPIKLKIDSPSEVRVFIPEEIYDFDAVFCAIYDGLGRVCIAKADITKKTIEIVRSASECPWPDNTENRLLRVSGNAACHYSRAKKQLLFYQTDKPEHCYPRNVTDDVLSVELFDKYALVHYADDKLALLNMYEKFTMDTRLLRGMVRQYADIAASGLPKQPQPAPYVSSRTFSDCLYVMFHDGIVCCFQKS